MPPVGHVVLQMILAENHLEYCLGRVSVYYSDARPAWRRIGVTDASDSHDSWSTTHESASDR